MSRYGLLMMALVVSAFVLVLTTLAPRPAELTAARRLARLGAAIEMYTVRHDGRLPPDLAALGDEQLLPADFIESLSKQVKYLAAGRERDALPAHGIVALEDPAPVAGSILVAVLLSDGAVLSVPADVVREAAARATATGADSSAGADGAAPLPRVRSAADGQLTVVFASDGQ